MECARDHADGTKVTVDQNGATLPVEASSETVEDANGSITGKLVPTLATAKGVEAFWGESKISPDAPTPSPIPMVPSH